MLSGDQVLSADLVDHQFYQLNSGQSFTVLLVVAGLKVLDMFKWSLIL